jgi:hypothetical protein
MCAQRLLLLKFAAEPPTRLTIAHIRDRFEADGTVHDVHKRRSGNPWLATSPTSSAMCRHSLQDHHRSSQNKAILLSARWRTTTVRSYLDETLPGQRIGRRGSVEYPPRSPDLTPLDFYLWGGP